MTNVLIYIIALVCQMQEMLNDIYRPCAKSMGSKTLPKGGDIYWKRVTTSTG